MTRPNGRAKAGRAHAQPDSVCGASISDPRIEAGRDAITRFAKVQGVSISELATISGMVSPNPLYNYLNGHSQYLSLRTLLAIRDAFPGTTLDELVGPLPSSSPPVEADEEPSTAAVMARKAPVRRARCEIWRSPAQPTI